jgi:hypothetical protein
MPTRRQFLTAAGVAMLATLLVVPVASAATNNGVPAMLQEILVQVNYVLGNMTTSINDGNSDLELKLWSAGDSVKNDTKQIPDIVADIAEMKANITEMNAALATMNSTGSQGTKTVTGYYQVFIPQNTSVGFYDLGKFVVHGDDAAYFTFGVSAYDDFTGDDGDYLGVVGMIWYNYHYFGLLEDNELVGGWIDCSFTAQEARVCAQFSDIVPSNSYVWITYTITTSADAEVEIVPSEI